MDLNLDNYSLQDLTSILQVPKKDINITILQQSLYDKIAQIKNVDVEKLPEKKEDLIEFYTKAMFKLLKNITSINSINTLEKDSTIIKDFEQTNFGNTFETTNTNEFINVREKLLPQLQNGSTFRENNSFVVKHNNLPSVNTFNSNLKCGDINPLTRKSLKKILNINTKFRSNYTTTTSTNFIIELPSIIKKVVSMKLIDSQFPEMVYTVSDKLGSNSFVVTDSSGSRNIDISNGSYSCETILSAINDALTASSSNVIKLHYNDNNGLMTFSSPDIFSLNFDYNDNSCPQLPSNIYKDQLTLGWLLGFRGNYIKPINPTQTNNLYKVRNKRPSIRPNDYLKNNITCCPEIIRNESDISNIYSGSSIYTGESLFDPHGSRYFLISVNDYQNSHNNTFISPFQYQTLADNNIIAKVSTEYCKSYCVEQPERIYFGPTDIAKLEIKIYDEFGRIVDINNADYSLTLELEVIYDL